MDCELEEDGAETDWPLECLVFRMQPHPELFEEFRSFDPPFRECLPQLISGLHVGIPILLARLDFVAVPRLIPSPRGRFQRWSETRIHPQFFVLMLVITHRIAPLPLKLIWEISSGSLLPLEILSRWNICLASIERTCFCGLQRQKC